MDIIAPVSLMMQRGTEESARLMHPSQKLITLQLHRHGQQL
jgi:hypothetical protein